MIPSLEDLKSARPDEAARTLLVAATSLDQQWEWDDIKNRNELQTLLSFLVKLEFTGDPENPDLLKKLCSVFMIINDCKMHFSRFRSFLEGSCIDPSILTRMHCIAKQCRGALLWMRSDTKYSGFKIRTVTGKSCVIINAPSSLLSTQRKKALSLVDIQKTKISWDLILEPLALFLTAHAFFYEGKTGTVSMIYAEMKKVGVKFKDYDIPCDKKQQSVYIQLSHLFDIDSKSVQRRVGEIADFYTSKSIKAW